MKQIIKNFPGTLKKYIDAIMKMNFGELLVHFFELLILLLIAAFLYVPIGLLKEILFSIFVFFSFQAGDTLNNVVDLIINLFSFVAFFFAFIYMFTKRYEDLRREQEKEVSLLQEQEQKQVEEPELPKERE